MKPQKPEIQKTQNPYKGKKQKDRNLETLLQPSEKLQASLKPSISGSLQ